MYAVPILIVLIAAIAAAAWSPIFALIFAVPLFLLFLVWQGMLRSSHRQRGAEGEDAAGRPSAPVQSGGPAAAGGRGSGSQGAPASGEGA